MSKLVACPSGMSGILTVADGVRIIYGQALYYSTKITGVVLPKETEYINKNLFERCEGFKSIEVSNDNPNYSSKDGILYSKDKSKLLYCPKNYEGKCEIAEETTEIESNAFDNCTKITSMYIQDKLTDIYYKFEGCTNLKDFYVSDNNEEFSSEDGVIYSKDKTSIVMCPVGREGTFVIKDGIQNINYYCFQNCQKLDNIVIPDSVTFIGDSSFTQCSKLDNMVIPDSISQISPCSFLGCTNLKNIKLSSNITRIGYNAFWECTSLEKIDIPNTVERMEQNTFYHCTSLKTINIPASVNEIQLEYGFFNGCTSLETINVDDENENYSSVDGILYNKDKTQFLAYPGGKSKDIKIPDNTKGIGASAFAGIDGFNVTIPDSVISIDNMAFEYRRTGSSFGASMDFIIYGNNDSYAMQYAQNKGYNFNKYRLKFLDKDGKLIDGKIQYVSPNESGVAPVYTNMEGYKFISWDKDFSNITCDTVVNGIYEKVEEIPENPSEDNKEETKDPETPSEDNNGGTETPENSSEDNGEIEVPSDDNKPSNPSTVTPNQGEESKEDATDSSISENDKETNTPKPDNMAEDKNETSGNTSDSTSIIGLYTMIAGAFGIYRFKKKDKKHK